MEPVGPPVEGGINKAALFDIDEATRIWKNRQLVGMDEIQAGLRVHGQSDFSPFESLATTDIWLDPESLEAFREIQRQRHLRLIRSRFLPGWVNEVTNHDTGGGEMSLTLFGGMDPLLQGNQTGRKPGNIRCPRDLAHLAGITRNLPCLRSDPLAGEPRPATGKQWHRTQR